MAFRASHLRRLAPICSLLLLLAYAISCAPAPKQASVAVATLPLTLTSGLLPTPTPTATPGTIHLAQARPANVYPSTPPMTDGPPTNLTDVFFVTTQTGFGVTADGGIYRSSDDGETWQIRFRRGGARFYQVVFANATSGIALGSSDCLTQYNNCEGPTILARTTDGGDIWDVIEPETPTPETMPMLPGLSITMMSSSVGYAIRDPDQQYFTVRGFETGMLATNDGGAHWQSVSLPPDTYASGGISFLSSLHGYIGASRVNQAAHTSTSELLETIDGGKMWKVRASNVAYSLVSLHFLDAQHGFAGSGGGGKESAEQDVLATNDGGTTWEVIYHHNQSVYGHGITRIHFSSLTNGWVALGGCNSLGQNGPCGGALWHTSDGGRTWMPNPDSSGQREVFRFSSVGDTAWIVPARDLLARSGFSVLFRTTDGGASWKPFWRPEALEAYDMQFVNPKVGWMNTNIGFVQTRDGGTHWQPYALGDPVSVTDRPFFVNESVVVAIHEWDLAHYRATLQSEELMRSEDGGRTWQSVPLPTQQADWRYATITFADALNGWIAVPLVCRAIDCPLVVLATTDGGRTWSQQSSELPINRASMVFGDARTGLLLGVHDNPFRNKLLLTSDGGHTWVEQSLPPDMHFGSSYYAPDPPIASGPRELWFTGCYCPKGYLSVGDYAILLHSTDEGQHWTIFRFGYSGPSWVRFFNSVDGQALFSRKLYVTHNGGLDWQEVLLEISP